MPRVLHVSEAALCMQKWQEDLKDGFQMTGDVMEQRGPNIVIWIDRKKNIMKLSQGEFVSTGRLEATYAGKLCPKTLQLPATVSVFPLCSRIEIYTPSSCHDHHACMQNSSASSKGACMLLSICQRVSGDIASRLPPSRVLVSSILCPMQATASSSTRCTFTALACAPISWLLLSPLMVSPWHTLLPCMPLKLPTDSCNPCLTHQGKDDCYSWQL